MLGRRPIAQHSLTSINTGDTPMPPHRSWLRQNRISAWLSSGNFRLNSCYLRSLGSVLHWACFAHQCATQYPTTCVPCSLLLECSLPSCNRWFDGAIRMAESDLSLGLLLFLLCEFFVGAIVGASIAKNQASGPRGMKIAAALALAVFIYLMVVNALATPRILHGPRPIILSLLGLVISSLTFGFCLWLICVLVACAGYWSAFIYF